MPPDATTVRQRGGPSESTVKARGGAGGGHGATAAHHYGGAGTGPYKPKGVSRKVTSESWDDDFLFQHSSTSSLALPLTHSPAPSSHRNFSNSSSSTAYSTASTAASSAFSHATKPSASSRNLQLSPQLNPNPSLDSLSSAWDIPSEAEEPTLTLSTSTPRASMESRSNTPSLSRTTGASTAGELTEAESLFSDADDSHIRIATPSSHTSRREQRDRNSMPPPPVPLARSGSKKWRALTSVFSGGNNSSSGGGAGRRTGPREVIGNVGLPAAGDIVVLGRRSRTPHSSNESYESSLSAGTGSTPTTGAGGSRVDLAKWREYDGSTTCEETSGDDETEEETTEVEGTDGEGGGRRKRRTSGGMRRRSTVLRRGGPPGTRSDRRSADSSLQNSPWSTSQLSFASSASAFGLSSLANGGAGSEWDATGTATNGGARRPSKLVKTRKPDRLASSNSLTETLLQSNLLGNGMEQPLLSSRRSDAGSSMTSTSGNSLSPSVATFRSPYPQPPPPPSPRARESVDEGLTRRVPSSKMVASNRQRSATMGSTPQETPDRRSVVTVEEDWLAISSPSPTVSSHGPPPLLPRTTVSSSFFSRSASSPAISNPPASTSRSPMRLLRRPSAGKVASHPPITGKTQAAAKAEKRPLSLGNMLSRSASSLPLAGPGSKRAPSPSPSTKSKSSILSRSKGKEPLSPTTSTSASRPSSAMSTKHPVSPTVPKSPVSSRPPHRASSSVTEVPRSSVPPPSSTSNLSFLSRARAFSRTSKPTASPSPAPNVPPPPPPSAPPRRRSSMKTPSSSTTTASVRDAPTSKPRLNENWSMPRPMSTVSNLSNLSSVSDASTASTLRPLGGFLEVRQPNSGPGRERTTRQQQGHRPSLSLSSVMPGRRSPSPARPPPPPSSRPHSPVPPRPNTALGGSIFASSVTMVDLTDESGGASGEVWRRNSLSDLRIPARITSAQARIEEDLERVKKFAKGVEDLKSLQRQYQSLVATVFAPSTPGAISPSVGHPGESSTLLLRRLEIEYQSSWEQADALISLGDGSPSSTTASPSKRDRCVSMAPSPSPRKRRSPSVDSMEETTAVEERQREMLRGVLGHSTKGASLPSRGLGLGGPATRPPLPNMNHSDPAHPPSTPSNAATSKAIRRVSRAGVSGIKDFLLRLRVRANEEMLGGHPASSSTSSLARRSVSDPNRSATPVSRTGHDSSSEEEDWDKDVSPPRRENTLTRRQRTRSEMGGASDVEVGAGDRMVLTTEAMPSLVLKVGEVQAKLEECLSKLKDLARETGKA